MSVIRWANPPEPRGPGKSVFDGAAVAAALRAHPGRWAAVAENPGNLGLHWFIKQGKKRAFAPAGSFEAVIRNVDGVRTVYARYVGEAGA